MGFLENFFSTKLLSLLMISWIFLPEFVLLNFVLLGVCYAVFANRNSLKRSNLVLGDSLSRIILVLNVCLSLTVLAYFKLATVMFGVIDAKFLTFSDQFLFDWSTFFIKVFIVLTYIVLLTIVKSYLKINSFKSLGYEFILISALAVAGSLFLVSSADFLSFYLSLELQALSFYVLTGFKTNSEFSAEAAIKYFLIGAFASILLLLGISFVYGSTGLTNFQQINLFLFSAHGFSYFDSALLLGLFLIAVALLFKLGLVPFHFWLPDAYQGAPLPVTALFSTVPKIAFFYLFVRVFIVYNGSLLLERIGFHNAYDFLISNIFSSQFSLLLLVSGFLSILIGSFMGLGQRNIKRFMAYSSISNLGFVGLGLGLNTLSGLQAALIYLIVYIVLTLGFFTIFMALRCQHSKSLYTLTQLSEIPSSILGLLLSLNLFSLAGIPPLIGFYSKFSVYLVLLDSQYFILTLATALLTILSTFYYVRVVSIIFFLPSLRSLFKELLIAPALDYVFVRQPLNLNLLHAVIFLSLINVLFFLHFDYLILLVSKFFYLQFS